MEIWNQRAFFNLLSFLSTKKFLKKGKVIAENNTFHGAGLFDSMKILIFCSVYSFPMRVLNYVINSFEYSQYDLQNLLKQSWHIMTFKWLKIVFYVHFKLFQMHLNIVLIYKYLSQANVWTINCKININWSNDFAKCNDLERWTFCRSFSWNNYDSLRFIFLESSTFNRWFKVLNPRRYLLHNFDLKASNLSLFLTGLKSLSRHSNGLKNLIFYKRFSYAWIRKSFFLIRHQNSIYRIGSTEGASIVFHFYL